MTNVATHERPVWRHKANFLLRADLSNEAMTGRFEQLWARKVDEGLFEICCIPFFTYGIALGDLVATDEKLSVVGVKGKLGHKVLRCAIANQGQQEKIHIALHDWVEREGLLYEWYKPGYLAVDVAVGAQMPDLSEFKEWQDREDLLIELDV